MKAKAGIAICLVLLVVSCAAGQLFTKHSSYRVPLQGPYTLVYYGSTYEAHYGAVVFMYPEHGVYKFVPYVPPPSASGWKTVTGVPGPDAVREAGRLLDVLPGYTRRLEMRAVMHKGSAIGYEVRPPIELPDHVPYYYEISYFLKGKTVRIQILPSPFDHGY